MLGQISSQRRQLSTKQWSGNKCSDVPTKIQTSSYAMNHRDWPGKQWRAKRQACHCTRLTACFSQTVKPFWRLILLIFCFLTLDKFCRARKTAALLDTPLHYFFLWSLADILTPSLRKLDLPLRSHVTFCDQWSTRKVRFFSFCVQNKWQSEFSFWPVNQQFCPLFALYINSAWYWSKWRSQTAEIIKQ